MKKRIKSLLGTFLLLILIGLFLIYNGVEFVSGPARAQEAALKNTVRLYENKNELKVTSVLNRFSLDHVYTLLQVDNEIIVILADATEVARIPFQALPVNMSGYGYYNQNVVFVKKNDIEEVFYDMDSLEIVFSFEMGE